jgi:hypothetical protein
VGVEGTMVTRCRDVVDDGWSGAGSPKTATQYHDGDEWELGFETKIKGRTTNHKQWKIHRHPTFRTIYRISKKTVELLGSSYMAMEGGQSMK